MAIITQLATGKLVTPLATISPPRPQKVCEITNILMSYLDVQVRKGRTMGLFHVKAALIMECGLGEQRNSTLEQHPLSWRQKTFV